MMPLNRKQLYELVWSKPMTKIADEYGLSDRGIAKLCERHSIPVPPRGYWARVQVGQKITRPPLISLNADWDERDEVLRKQIAPLRNFASDELVTIEMPPDLTAALETELTAKNKIRVPDALRNPHRLIEDLLSGDKDRERRGGGADPMTWGLYKDEKPPDVTEKRRRRILDTLLKALERRNLKVEKGGKSSEILVWTQKDKIRFSLEEYVRQIRRELTQDEKNKKARYGIAQNWTQEKHCTGQLRLEIKSGNGFHSKTKITESADIKLDDKLNKVVVDILKSLWEEKVDRLIAEEKAVRQRRQEIERLQKESQRQAEKLRRDKLQTDAGLWHKAEQLRAYIAAVIRAHHEGGLVVESEMLDRWRAWAIACAEDIDPIRPDSLSMPASTVR